MEFNSGFKGLIQHWRDQTCATLSNIPDYQTVLEALFCYLAVSNQRMCTCQLFPSHHTQTCGLGSVVGIVIGYGLDGPGIESHWEWDFPHLSRPALGPKPASCTMGTGSFPGVKSSQGVTTPHPLLLPWVRKGRAIPLLPLWAIQPVQSFSACTRVHFTFFFFFLTLN
jgi:hypothetical protein